MLRYVIIFILQRIDCYTTLIKSYTILFRVLQIDLNRINSRLLVVQYFYMVFFNNFAIQKDVKYKLKT